MLVKTGPTFCDVLSYKYVLNSLVSGCICGPILSNCNRWWPSFIWRS